MLEGRYSTRVRIAELLGMDLDAVDLANATARGHGKGDQWRIVPLGRTAVAQQAPFRPLSAALCPWAPCALLCLLRPLPLC